MSVHLANIWESGHPVGGVPASDSRLAKRVDFLLGLAINGRYAYPSNCVKQKAGRVPGHGVLGW
jgi:hypothetical protein